MGKGIAILGAGTWGTALARVLALAGHSVTVWSILPREVEELSRERRHKNLPGAVIPDSVLFTDSLREAVEGRDGVIFAVPSPYVRSTAAKVMPFIERDQIIVDVAKGIEAESLMTLTEVIREELERREALKGISLVALSGPTHAEEVALDLPTTIVSASEDPEAAAWVQGIFEDSCLRVYTNSDVRGVELCGALKNIIALATGVAAGLGYGDNTKAALITRGLAEMLRLGAAMGCDPMTFSGLAGMGDLIVTATSVHSRNNRCGMLIGRGASPKEAVEQVGMVVEGINALPAAIRLAERYQVEMPIVMAARDVLSGEVSPADAVQRLMGRELKAEHPLH